jgi:arylformamidase
LRFDRFAKSDESSLQITLRHGNQCKKRLCFMKIYDVSVPISEDTPVFEGDPKIRIDICLELSKGDPANLTAISMCAHTGTHVDAPNHFIDGAGRVEDIELEKLIGDCRVVEIPPDALSVTTDHLEHALGCERVLFKTRNSAFWSNPEQGFRKDFTYIEPEAAQVLADSGVKLVGIDYLSVEQFGSEGFPTHLALLRKEIVIVEGLDLSAVPPGDYELFCLPLRLRGGKGDGAPARVLLRKR